MSLDDTSFTRIADATLESFMDAIEAVLGDQADVDLEGGILTIELDSGGQYVINKHAPNRQIWMSSPASGATFTIMTAMRNNGAARGRATSWMRNWRPNSRRQRGSPSACDGGAVRSPTGTARAMSSTAAITNAPE
ncbi:MAG: iron donor protein CyaY [Rhodospirillales bacterium]